MRIALRLVMFAACTFWIAAPAFAKSAKGDDLFQNLAGSWSGGGSVTVQGGGTERIRCNATYSPAGPTQLSLNIRCASDSFKLDIAANLARQGNRLSGSYREATFGTSGSVSGTAGGQQINAVVSGGGTTARLDMRLNGNSQSVSLSSTGQISGSASLVLRR